MNSAALTPEAARLLQALRDGGATHRGGALTDRELAAAAGLDARDVIDAAAELIGAGWLVIADGAGRWIGTPDEADRYQESLRRRACKIFLRARAIRDVVRRERRASRGGQLGLPFVLVLALLGLAAPGCRVPLDVRPLPRPHDPTPPEGWGDEGAELRRVLTACGARTGDANCDGRVDMRDVPAFALALSDPEGWARSTGCPLSARVCLCDCNGDGVVDFRDINSFAAILAASGRPVTYVA